MFTVGLAISQVGDGSCTRGNGSCTVGLAILQVGNGSCTVGNGDRAWWKRKLHGWSGNRAWWRRKLHGWHERRHIDQRLSLSGGAESTQSLL